MIWFTSDQHWDHANVIKYCNRPFESVEEMNDVMITRWNEVVRPKDIVYHLGDFTLGNDANDILSCLHGDIRFVVPDFHHDQRWIKTGFYVTGVELLPPLYVVTIHDVVVVLCHYPIAVWDRKHYGSWHLYGHVHYKEFKLPGFSMNVGVDLHNFYPISFDEIEQCMIDMGWHEGWKEFG